MIVLPKNAHPPNQEGGFGLYRCGVNQDGFPIKPFFEWYLCRDSFHFVYDRNRSKEFFYTCQISQLRDFFKEVEKDLHLVIRTKFYETNREGVCCIKPAPFWRRQKVRMALFTIILRAGHKYSGDWKDCLFSHPYIKTTKEAVEYFFNGNTRYIGKEGGWHSQFDESAEVKLNELLSEPNKAGKFLQRMGLKVRKLCRVD